MNAIVKLESAKSALLGTAAWYRGGGGATVRPFQTGDIWLGRTEDGEAYGSRDDRHAFCCAGTRGGKGISVIVPNLILWPGSVLVVDPKGENAMVTARARGKGSRHSKGRGQKVLILDPFGEIKTGDDDYADMKARFNPLDMLSVNSEESVDEAVRIAEAMVVSEQSADPFFEESARSLLKAVMLHVVSARGYESHERNLVTVRRLIVAGDLEARKLAERSGKKNIPSAHDFLFLAMRSNPAFGGVVANYGAMFLDMANKADRTFMGVLSSAAVHTDFIESPGMKRCLSASDFRLSELKTDPKGISIYLCLPERYRETHFRWLRMMVSLTIAEMERVREQPASHYPVLMVLDEFPALRRMRSIENAAAQIAGFGVKLFFIVQTLGQLHDLYKDNWETLLANAGSKLFFSNDDHFTRKYVSELIGETEVVKTVRNFSQSQGQSASVSESTSHGTSTNTSLSPHGISNVSYGTSKSSSQSLSISSNHSLSGGLSETIQKRPLVTPDEVGRLFGNRDHPTALALVSGYQPMFLRRSFYFNEKWLRGHYDANPAYTPPPTLRELPAIVAREKAEAQAVRQERKRIAALKQADCDWRLAMKAAQDREEEARKVQAEIQKARERQLERQRDDEERRTPGFWEPECLRSTALVIAMFAIMYVVWWQT